MALEAGTYVNDLVSTNPVGSTDFISQGDDHIRLLKSVLKTTFPNATRPFYLPTTVALQTATVNVLAADQSKVIPVSCEAAARTVNLPANAGIPDGYQVTIVKADHSPNMLTIDGNGSDTINGALTVLLWQRFQSAVCTWCATLGGWVANIQEVPPIGQVKPVMNSTLQPGWLWANGLTIGNAASAATARANADCLGLFTVLWDSLSNTYAAVSGGRGASAAADFAANKQIAIPNFSGRTAIGKDVLGGGADAGLIGAIIADALGAKAGTETHTLIAAEMPVHTHSASTSSSGAHTHDLNIPCNDNESGSGMVGAGANAETFSDNVPGGAASSGAHTHTVTVGNAGGDTAHTNLPPAIVTLWAIKL